MTNSQKPLREIDWKLSDSMAAYDSVVITLTDTTRSHVYDTIVNGKLNDPSSLKPYNVPDSIPASFQVQIVGLNTQGDTLYASSFTVNVDGKIVTQPPSISQLLLTQLQFSSGTVIPSFTPLTSNYLVVVPYTSNSLLLTAAAVDTQAVLLLGKDTVRANTPYTVLIPVGTSNFVLSIAAPRGAAVNRIYIKVERAAGSEAGLQSLVVGALGLTPAFNSDSLHYALVLPADTDSVYFAPVTLDSAATITASSDTTPVTPQSGAYEIKVPATGTDTVKFTVTAEDKTTTKTYTVLVSRAAGNDARLQSLVVGALGLTPVFNSDSLHYALVLPADTDSVDFAPVPLESAATLTASSDTTPVTPQSGAYEIKVPATGTDTVKFTVTAEDKSTIKTYTVLVSRAPSNDAALSNLMTSQGSLIPSFDPALYTYVVTVDTNTITVTPTARHALTQITVNNTAVASGAASAPIPLLLGLNPIVIAVTAPDGKTKASYVVTVQRVSNNALLSNLALDSAAFDSSFLPNRFSYRVTVPRLKSMLRLTTQAADVNATVSMTLDSISYPGLGDVYNVPLKVGDNLIQVKVVAASGDADLYTILVTRTPSANDTLKQMYFNKNSSLTPQILLNPIPNALYSDTLANTDSVLNFGPEPQDSNALVVVNYTQPAIVGQDTIYLPLETDSLPGGGTLNLRPPLGSSVITATVIAENKAAKLTYAISVFHRYSNNADLSNLEVFVGTSPLPLNPSFSPTQTGYSVSNYFGAVQMRATLADTTATMTVNGQPLASDSLSASEPPSLQITVTAQDKKTVKVYAVSFIPPI